MAITYFGSASNPSDNGSISGTPIAVTPPASMQVGDLVVVYGYYRGTSTISVSNTGGQTWTASITSRTAGNPTLSYFVVWCRFNGTWSANPSLAFSTSTTNCTVVMHVFRPSSSSNFWDVESTPGFFDITAPSSPFNCSGVTPSPNTTSHDSVVAIGSFMSDDDNTWTNISSTFGTLGNAQYRNVAGSDTSSCYGYIIINAAGTTIGGFSAQQATLGGDPYVAATVVFYEFAATVPTIPNKIYSINQSVNRASTF